MVESRSNRSRCGRACIIVLLIILLMPYVSILMSVIQLSIEDAARRVVLYQSPAGGEDIRIGEMRFGEVDVDPPPSEKMNWYSIDVTVLDWGGCTDMLDLKYRMWWMDLNEFLSLNASEREALPFDGYRYISYTRTLVGSSESDLTTVGKHVWAIQYVGTYGNASLSILRVSIRVSILQNPITTP